MSVETAMLNTKLTNLRKQYQNNISSMDSIRSQYEKSVNDQLERAQENMLNKLKEHDEGLRYEYEKAFNDYSEKIISQLNEKIDEMNSDYIRLKKENDSMRQEMIKIEAELSSEIGNINKKISDKDNRQKSEAQKRMEKVYDDFQSFSLKYPHDFFEPNAANALLMQMESTKIDFRSGFYEACMANSSNIEFQMTMLKERIKKSFEQWNRYFFQLESYTRQVSEFIDSPDFRIIKNDYFEKELTVSSEREADTLDFWSNGEYKKLAEEISVHMDFIDSVSEADGETKKEKIINYLKLQRKKGLNVTFEELSEKIERVTALHKSACSMMLYIHSGFLTSYERAAEISKKILSVLSGERSGNILLNGFKDNDIRNEYIILSEEADKKINVIIFPVCVDKTTIVNCIGIYIEHTGSGTLENLKATEENIRSSISKAADKISVIFESNCQADINTEEAIKIIKSKAEEKRKKELLSKRRVR